jgi:hypothetical protein
MSIDKFTAWLDSKPSLDRAQMAAELKRLKKSKTSSYSHFGCEGAVFSAMKTYNYYSPWIQAWGKHATLVMHKDRADFGGRDPLHGQLVKAHDFMPTPEQVEAEYLINISLDAAYGVDESKNFDLHRSELQPLINHLT